VPKRTLSLLSKDVIENVFGMFSGRYIVAMNRVHVNFYRTGSIGVCSAAEGCDTLSHGCERCRIAVWAKDQDRFVGSLPHNFASSYGLAHSLAERVAKLEVEFCLKLRFARSHTHAKQAELDFFVALPRPLRPRDEVGKLPIRDDRAQRRISFR